MSKLFLSRTFFCPGVDFTRDSLILSFSPRVCERIEAIWVKEQDRSFREKNTLENNERRQILRNELEIFCGYNFAFFSDKLSVSISTNVSRTRGKLDENRTKIVHDKTGIVKISFFVWTCQVKIFWVKQTNF